MCIRDSRLPRWTRYPSSPSRRIVHTYSRLSRRPSRPFSIRPCDPRPPRWTRYPVSYTHLHAFPVIDLRATGANILRLRKKRGLTVRDLQAYFGFEAPQAIYRWQSGVSLPTVDNLYALSILLNVTMEDILIVRNRSVCEQQAELDCSVLDVYKRQMIYSPQSG